MADRTNDGGSAFPLNTANICNPGAFAPTPGMSLHDWFAGQALMAIIAKIPTEAFRSDGTLYQRVAIAAFLYADAMLAARKGGDA